MGLTRRGRPTVIIKRRVLTTTELDLLTVFKDYFIPENIHEDRRGFNDVLQV